MMSSTTTTDEFNLAHALIEDALEKVAARAEDISPAVYAHFFEKHPAYIGAFRVVDSTQPPHGCGQMLFEILSLLQDCAAAKPYVAGYMQQVASTHTSFGIVGTEPFHDFLTALTDVIARLMASDWTVAHAQAWAEQNQKLVEFMVSDE